MNQYIYDMINNTGTLSTEDIILRIVISALFGVLIFVSYRMTHAGSIYSVKFNITLVVLTILTTMVMTVIGNNVALSLGMVGALSIIRFRTSIKDSRDTAYIFWTIIIGICCGVGDYVVAGVGSAVVFVVLLLLGRVKNEHRMLLIVRANREKEQEIRRTIFDFFVKTPIIKAENSTEEKVEFIYEIDSRSINLSQKRESKSAAAETRAQETIMDKLYALGGIDYVNLVSQSDEIS